MQEKGALTSPAHRAACTPALQRATHTTSYTDTTHQSTHLHSSRSPPDAPPACSLTNESSVPEAWDFAVTSCTKTREAATRQQRPPLAQLGYDNHKKAFHDTDGRCRERNFALCPSCLTPMQVVGARTPRFILASPMFCSSTWWQRYRKQLLTRLSASLLHVEARAACRSL